MEKGGRARPPCASRDVLCYGTTTIHPLVIRAVLVKTPEVVDYQARQTARGIDLAVVAGGLLDPGPLGERLRAALVDAGLVDPLVAVRTVPALERQPGTGKLRRVIPL